MKGFIEQIYRNNKNYKGVVFSDRDGTINGEHLEILPTVAKGIRILNENNIAVVVVTNQPVIARGLITVKELEGINDTLFEALKKEGAYIDAIYSCPHHPEMDHPDIPPHAIKYRIKCECRKPGLAMYKKALVTYSSPKILGVIGDQTRDVAAGKKLSIPTVTVRTGYRGEDGIYDVTPDFICDNFLDAVQILLQ